MKKVFKIITIFVFIILIGFSQLSYVYADEVEEEQKQNIRFNDIFSTGKDFIQDGKQTLTGENGEVIFSGVDTGELKKDSSTIFNIMLAIGTILTVIVGGILGIKFMIASAEDKAKIKEMMIPYVIGCIVIYGAFGIWKFVLSLLEML